VLDAEGTAVQRLTHQVVAALQAGAPALAARWRTDGARVAPGAPILEAGTAHSAEVVRALDALARGIGGDACWQRLNGPKRLSLRRVRSSAVLSLNERATV